MADSNTPISTERSGKLSATREKGPSSRTIVFVAALAFVCKIALALWTFGTNDVFQWELFRDVSRHAGVLIYRASAEMNHPPSMIHLLLAEDWLSRVTGVAFPFWLRLPATSLMQAVCG
jgi:hypothetical protein